MLSGLVYASAPSTIKAQLLAFCMPERLHEYVGLVLNIVLLSDGNRIVQEANGDWDCMTTNAFEELVAVSPRVLAQVTLHAYEPMDRPLTRVAQVLPSWEQILELEEEYPDCPRICRVQVTFTPVLNPIAIHEKFMRYAAVCVPFTGMKSDTARETVRDLALPHETESEEL